MVRAGASVAQVLIDISDGRRTMLQLHAMRALPPLRRIFHPTNLEGGARSAFLHALGLAVAGPATLTLLHVGVEEELNMEELPHVRSTLRRWGVISTDQGSDELRAKGIGVRKVLDTGDPLQACINHLEDHAADLVVMHTHQREGGQAWINGRVAEPLVRRTGLPTLIVPGGAHGFVDADRGTMKLQRILLPVASAPHPDEAIALAAWMAEAAGATNVRFKLLSIGESEVQVPDALPRHHRGWVWEFERRPGDVIDGILRTERDWRPDLIVMVTLGHDGLLDTLRGSTTERVLRRMHGPLLTRLA